MKKSYLLLLPALLLLYACQSTEDWIKDPVTLVNPLMGTASSYEFSAGNTYPAIGVPWGMHTWTPQTGRNGDGWTYTYDAHKLVGFKQTHQPSPWINDYGCFSLFPVSRPFSSSIRRLLSALFLKVYLITARPLGIGPAKKAIGERP